MNTETQKIFDFLYRNFSWTESRSKLPSIFKTFACCSYDESKDRCVINSEVKAIDFDRLTKWFYQYQHMVPQSADAMSFAGNDVFLIEFKAGDQVKTEWNKYKLIRGVSGKIDGSLETIYNNILSHVHDLNFDAVQLRFYLVVDAEEMGIGAQVMALLPLLKGLTFRDIQPTGNEKIDILINDVLKSLNESAQNNGCYKDIDIWFSEAFEIYLSAYHISDISNMILHETRLSNNFN